MKYIIFSFIIIMLWSCSRPKHDIEGTWKLTSIDYSAFLKDLDAQEKDMLQAQLQAQLQEMKNKTFFTFSETKQVSLKTPNKQGQFNLIKGTYKISKTKDSLYLMLEEPEAFEIVKLNKLQMELKTDDTPKRILYLEKEEH